MEEPFGFVETTVSSTRIRLARNLSGYPFPNRLDKERAKEVTAKVASALGKLDKFTRYETRKLP